MIRSLQEIHGVQLLPQKKLGVMCLHVVNGGVGETYHMVSHFITGKPTPKDTVVYSLSLQDQGTRTYQNKAVPPKPGQNKARHSPECIRIPGRTWLLSSKELDGLYKPYIITISTMASWPVPQNLTSD